LLLADPSPVIVTVLMPLLLTPFLIPAARTQLRAAGVVAATGAEQVVPGMAVMFGFMGTSLAVALFFREHAWGTWQRLRACPVSTLDLVVGKVVPLYVAMLAQLVVLFAIGAVVFGYRINGSVLALAVIALALTAVIVAFGVMLVAVFTTMDQAMVLGNLGGMVMTGLGGALTPASTLPVWAQSLAHVTPAYWSLQAIRDVTLDHAGLADVLGPVLVLLVFTVVFAAIAWIRFRPSDVKIGTT
jgi:ABC-2 type transport system permease protein